MQSVFAHLILDVQNMERSIGFYRDSLGFSLRELNECDGHRLAYLETGHLEILLLEQPLRERTPIIERGGGVVLKLRVRNLHDVARQLKASSVSVLRDLEDPLFGERTLLIADPDGYAILLTEPVGTVH